MTWTKHSTADVWTATGWTGTRWDIVHAGDRYGVIVANWNLPDWYADTLIEAQRIAEERDAAPPIPPEKWIIEPVGDDSWMSRPPPRYEDDPPASDD
jgi:hypothetical protein